MKNNIGMHKLQSTLISTHEDITVNLGKILGRSSMPGDVYLLSGDLGSGKTRLTQGILKGLGSSELARSPTFVLVTEYEARIPVYHMDFYRLDDHISIERMQIDEYLYGDGICVIEWANKSLDVFPEDSIKIHFDISKTESERQLTFSTRSTKHSEIFSELERYIDSKGI